MASDLSPVVVGSPISVMGAGLNALASGSGLLSGVITKPAALYFDAILSAAFAATVVADAPVDLYVVQQDGTTYEDSDTTNGYPRDGYLGSFRLRAVSTAQVLRLRNLLTPARDFKLMVINSSGKAMGATGNTLFIDPHTDEAS
ncbi:MAG TPA: hypothetical protein VGM20_04295 [Gemmatimonadales bacterium]|jgi:hypothetical protein